jgi:hypothetical protein
MSAALQTTEHVLAVRTPDVAAVRRGFPCCAGFAGERPQGRI